MGNESSRPEGNGAESQVIITNHPTTTHRHIVAITQTPNTHQPMQIDAPQQTTHVLATTALPAHAIDPSHTMNDIPPTVHSFPAVVPAPWPASVLANRIAGVPVASPFGQEAVSAKVIRCVAATPDNIHAVAPSVLAASHAVKQVTHGDATIAYLDSLTKPESNLDGGQINVVTRMKEQLLKFQEVAIRHREEQAKAAAIIQQQLAAQQAAAAAASAAAAQVNEEESMHQAKRPCPDPAAASSTDDVAAVGSPSYDPLSPAPFWSPVGGGGGGSVYTGESFEVMRDDVNVDGFFNVEETMEQQRQQQHQQQERFEQELFVEECMRDPDEQQQQQQQQGQEDESKHQQQQQLSHVSPDGMFTPLSSTTGTATCLDSRVQYLFDNSLPSAKRTINLLDSRIFLENYQSLGVLEQLEHGYSQGTFGLNALKQSLMIIGCVLEPPDHETLWEEFDKLAIQKQQQQHSSSSQPSLSGSSESQESSSERGSGSISSTPSTVVQQTRLILPEWNDDLTPTEPAPDDTDGVARMRLTMLFQRPPEATSNSKHSHPQPTKRKHSAVEDDDEEAVTDEVVEHDPQQHHHPSVSSGAAALNSPMKSPPIHRLGQVNQAFVRMSGYTQQEIVELQKRVGQRLLFKFVRKDFARAFHQMLIQSTLYSQNDRHCYMVRVAKDGSETWCLLHIRNNCLQGVFNQGVISILPLPGVAEGGYPPPPYIEGYDQPMSVLLTGYWQDQQNAPQ